MTTSERVHSDVRMREAAERMVAGSHPSQYEGRGLSIVPQWLEEQRQEYILSGARDALLDQYRPAHARSDARRLPATPPDPTGWTRDGEFVASTIEQATRLSAGETARANNRLVLRAEAEAVAKYRLLWFQAWYQGKTLKETLS